MNKCICCTYSKSINQPYPRICIHCGISEKKTMRTKEQIQKRISFIDMIMNIQKVMIDNHCWNKENGNSIILSYKEEKEKLQKELEELNKPKRWKPEMNENYFYVHETSQIFDQFYKNDAYDQFRYKTRNCFKTKEEAEEELERILFVNEVRDFIEEENEGFDLRYCSLDLITFNKAVSKFDKEKLIKYFTYGH